MMNDLPPFEQHFARRVAREAVALLGQRQPPSAPEHVVDMPDNAEPVRIRHGGREWSVFFDETVDEFVCRPVKASL